MGRHTFSVKPLSLVVSLLTSFYALDAVSQQPDAGQLLKEQPKPPLITPQKPIIVNPGTPEQQAPSEEGATLLVNGFRISGAVLIAEPELQELLAPAIGKELTLEQLKAHLLTLTLYYAQKGYLTRVVLPPQDIEDGIIDVQIVEGQRGSIQLNKEGDRINAERAHRMIEKRLSDENALSLVRLGEAMTILNEQPGLDANVDLKPGSNEGAIDLAVNAQQKPLFDYTFDANNHGSYGTGEEQVNGSIIANNPFGLFDSASLLLNKSEGSNFARADYSLALGNSGLRAGINASYLDYELVPSEFDSLEAEGSASTAGATASYPISRRSDFYLTLFGGYNQMRLKDETLGDETSNRRVATYNLGLDGFTLLNMLGGSVASFRLNYVYGDSDQRNSDALAADQIARKMQGSFQKLEYNLGWLMPITTKTSLNTTVRGQVAGTNLDSALQMSLGGVNGIRAYPTGEATGDEGWLLQVDVSRPLIKAITGHLFYDLGGITLNHTLWENWNAGTPGLHNSYTLSGWGAAADWRLNDHVLFAATVATPLEDNPGADANGNNVDSDDNHTRFWLSLNARF